jgi:hypothetical protein
MSSSSSSISRMSTRVLLLRRRLSAFYVWRAALQVRRVSRSASSGLEFCSRINILSLLGFRLVLSFNAMHWACGTIQTSTDFHGPLGGEAKRSEIWSQPIVRLRVLFSPL